MDNQKKQVELFQEISTDISKPRITIQGVLTIVIIWSVYSALSAISSNVPNPPPYFTKLIWQVLNNLGKMILSFPVWLIVIRWMYNKPWYWKGIAHLFLAPLYLGLGFAFQYAISVLFGNKMFIQQLKLNPGWLIFFGLFIYILQFTLYHSYEILRDLRIKDKVMQQLLTLQKEQELAILKSQINPHFLFNTLNSINAMVSINKEKTCTMINQLEDMLKYVIESNEVTIVTLEKELQFVKDYVELELNRMGDRLTVEYKIDESLLEYKIPPMILQPLIENAIKHGLAPLEDGGKLFLQIQKTNGVQFTITDTGVGLENKELLKNVSGIGLRNINSRLCKIYGENAKLIFNSVIGSGFEITFTLPLK